MTGRKILYVFAAFCACVHVAAAQKTEGGFEARLAEVSAATETIECDFTLTKTMAFMASDVVSQGRFYYLRSVGISLDFSEPAGDRITMGRDKFRITSAGRTNVVSVTSNPMLRQLQRMLTACMTGDVAMLREGSRMSWTEEDDYYVVTLTPDNRRARNMVKQIVLTFEKENMSLEKLRMEEASGDVSEYGFYNKTFNGGTDPARFDIR